MKIEKISVRSKDSISLIEIFLPENTDTKLLNDLIYSILYLRIGSHVLHTNQKLLALGSLKGLQRKKRGVYRLNLRISGVERFYI